MRVATLAYCVENEDKFAKLKGLFDRKRGFQCQDVIITTPVVMTL
jgi:hypothetical protein